MDSDVAEEMMNFFEQINCPFVCDVDVSYLSRLLLTPSLHRMRVLSWLFTRIDENIEHEIVQFNRNPETFKGLQEIDGEVQLLTEIASSLGLCLPTDFHLIRGKAPSEPHLALWRNLLAIVSSGSLVESEIKTERKNSKNRNIFLYIMKSLRVRAKDIVNVAVKSGCIITEKLGSVSQRAEIINKAMESILHLCNVACAISTTCRLLPPAIEKELEITQKISKFSGLRTESTSGNPTNQLETLQIELDKQLNLLQNLQKTNPCLSAVPDDSSQIDTLVRSLGVTLNDLTQLQTSFLQTFHDHFQPYCDKEQLKFSKLGSIIHQVDTQLCALLKLLRDMKTLKSCHQNLMESGKA